MIEIPSVTVACRVLMHSSVHPVAALLTDSDCAARDDTGKQYRACLPLACDLGICCGRRYVCSRIDFRNCRKVCAHQVCSCEPNILDVRLVICS